MIFMDDINLLKLVLVEKRKTGKCGIGRKETNQQMVGGTIREKSINRF